MLQKIVWCEARGEDLRGQALVANVILNRVKAKGFPNDIESVIFEPKQFQPIHDGSWEKAKPTEMQIEAVNLALTGTDYSQGATFFIANRIKTGSWHERALEELFLHGNHTFFKQ